MKQNGYDKENCLKRKKYYCHNRMKARKKLEKRKGK